MHRPDVTGGLIPPWCIRTSCTARTTRWTTDRWC